jgi:hypothetical protein
VRAPRSRAPARARPTPGAAPSRPAVHTGVAAPGRPAAFAAAFGKVPVQAAPGALLQRAPLIPPDREPPPPRRGGPLPFREATELADCIRIMGEANAAFCRQEVLGEPQPPAPTHHQLPGITTPLPIDVRLNPDATASLRVNAIDVVFEPDAQSTDVSLTGRAETDFKLKTGPIHFKAPTGDRVASFTGPGPTSIRIQTTYGPGATPAAPSEYGRGTTPADVAAGTTSLGFHEGSHGTDFLEFMAAHPYPRFVGRVGMTVAQFQAAMDAYTSARERYGKDMHAFTEQRTHCVGRTIDQYNAAQGVKSAICTPVAPATP